MNLTVTIKERFDSLGVSYKGVQQNGSLVSGNPVTTASSYFYHPDHLGSSSYITGVNGEEVEHIEYLPYGELLLDERSTNWYTRYRFTGKEQDEETGLIYISQRYLDPKTSVWLSVDELRGKYPNIGSYVYCAGNPVKYVDPDGRKLIFAITNNTGKVITRYQYSNGNFWLMKKNSLGIYYKSDLRYDPQNQKNSKTMYRILEVYRKIENSNNKILKSILHKLETSEINHFLSENFQNINNVVPIFNQELKKTGELVNINVRYTITNLDLDATPSDELKKIGSSDMSTIVHEMRHQYDFDINNFSDDLKENTYNDPSEIRAVYLENIARKIERLKMRKTYGDNLIDNRKLNNPPNNIIPKK